ncbi:hypothetical protein FHS43_006033 [Streptosporangium becharense]|uniref:Preprotein translocase subunit YajC n=1 Tax=Streptosporangium becharense TaxID=1816182 RepID=A0A7W9IHN6_9ACTN|nr:DUF5666 domain-containing protein [Streptosporangium becharense]MBB2914721.1 hypothetical protein [Streptosporangium becharense]MBB5820878.1 preprotein translocase subunit YajC [Streptosporangium becharense]
MGGNADGTVSAERTLETSPFPGDLDSELAPRQGRGLSKVTLALGAGVFLVAGVIIGIQAQKAMGAPAVVAGGPAAGVRQLPTAPGTAGGRQGGQPVPPGAQNGQNGQGGQLGQPGTQGGQNGQGAQQGDRLGQLGQPGGRGGVTIGTVQRVDGTTLYVKIADGSVVTVKTTGDTAVRVTKEAEVADLKPGGTVVVQGGRAGDGSVTATSISEGGGRR